MPDSSVLIGGGGTIGRSAAFELARRGMDVTLLQDGAASPSDAEAVARVREAGVEVRFDTHLVGYVAVDQHVEAELSDGRVENYDVVAVPGGRWHVVASEEVRQADAVADVSAALAGLQP